MKENLVERIKRTLTGHVQITMLNEETGDVIVKKKNLVVNNAYKQLAQLLSGNLSNNSVSKIAFGSDGTAPVVTNTSVTHLVPPVWVNTTTAYPSSTSVLFTAVWNAAVNNAQTIKEIGLFCADNTMVARTTFQEMKKSTGWVWTIQWTLSYTV